MSNNKKVETTGDDEGGKKLKYNSFARQRTENFYGYGRDQQPILEDG